MNYKTLDGKLYSGMISRGAANLRANKKTVNELNVFPIPDGDTGDNMYMTLSSGCERVYGDESSSLSYISSKAAEGMLFGARGNSGVILSRIFAGIAKGFENTEEADLYKLAEAFEEGIRQSYNAVTTPVEGTILTVFKDSTRYANSRINEDSTLNSYFDDFICELKESLKRTPDLLDVLKKAGVVDSGGAGLLYIAEGIRSYLKGDAAPESENTGSEAPKTQNVDLSLFGPDSELEFGYCTEFLLRLQNKKVDPDNFDLDGLIQYLNDIGDSVVAFKDGTVVKVHVHTFNPGTVLDYCRRFGEYLTIKIENMTLQHHNTTIKNNFDPDNTAPAEEAEEAAYTEPVEGEGEEEPDFFRTDVRKKYGIVAVAAGEGVKSMFSEICVDEVVDGGQSMNPSAKDLVDAFDKINAETIFVLPNNKNIILTARQAAELYKKADIRVINTKNVGDGYAVVSMMDLSSEDPEEIISAAEEVIKNVVTGEVSHATRDAEMNGISVKEGDVISFIGDKVCYSGPSRKDACMKLSEASLGKSKDVILLIAGEAPEENETEEIRSALQAECPDAEIYTILGEQPVFDYIIVFE